MSGIGLVAAVAIGLVITAIEVVVVARIARRLVPIARRLGDPAQRASLLSEETRAALGAAGIDLDALEPAALADRPELQRRVEAELRGALKAAWRSRGPGAAAPAFETTRPPPIDAPRGAPLGVVAAVAVALLGAGAIWWLAR